MNISISMPVVEPIFGGLLGNRLFAFCIGKIVAEELKFQLYSKPIYGFPNTYNYENNKPSKKYSTEIILGSGKDLGFIDIAKIINNNSLRNIQLQGFFHKYEYLKRYKDKIRSEWLKMDTALIPIQDPNNIVIHIRTQAKACWLPFEYYEKALSKTCYNQIFICIDEPTSNYLENFKKYNPIVISSRSINKQMNALRFSNELLKWDEISKINFDDFVFISSFNKIITSQSTYAWWAAFLSKAQEIYAPFCYDEEYQTYGKVDESRYHYIDTIIGKLE